MSENEMFSINKETYEWRYRNLIESINESPKSLLQFPILLPFHLPFKSGTTASVKYGDGEFCLLHFYDVCSTDSVDGNIISKQRINRPIKKTRVEMVYFKSDRFEDYSESEFLSYHFDKMLDYLNYLIRSYSIVKQDYNVHMISIDMLEFMTMYRVINLDNWSEERTGIFLTNTNIQLDKKDLTSDEYSEVTWYAKVIMNNENPLILSSELMRDARRYMSTGFYRESIINAQSGVETFLGTLLRLLYLNEGLSEEAIEEKMESLSFMSIIKKEFPQRLGGNWNISNSSGVVCEWYKKCYQIRNRIVHGGYIPNLEECRWAFHCAVELKKYVVKLSKNKSELEFLDVYFGE